MLVLNKTTGLQNNSRLESRQGVFVIFFRSCLLTTILSPPQTIDAKFEKQLLRIVSLINEWNFSGPWQPVRSIRGHPFPMGRKICISAQICVPRNNLSQKLCSSALPKSTLFDPVLFGRFNIQGGQICVIIDLCNKGLFINDVITFGGYPDPLPPPCHHVIFCPPPSVRVNREKN